ncbi:MAG: PAAR domain-containing protein [Saprospiraceae bacterium]|nr:PAAR domain-containing protein [Saprospiraceae bacterium]
MAFPAATTGCQHTCPAYDGDHPHKGGPVLQGSANVFLNGKSACRTGDTLQCDSSSPDTVIGGSTTIFINGLPATRQGDPTAHGGVVIEGSPTVFMG